MRSRNDPCWCGSGKKFKKCHFPNEEAKEDFSKLAARYKKQYKILLKTPQQIEGISKSCKLAASMLRKTCEMAKEGVTTNELNTFVMKLTSDAGAIPAPLGYGKPPFPKAICTSLNEVICHGIPNDIPLKDGDILNIDITCILNGYYGDTSAMVMIGNVSEKKKRVVETSYKALMESIAILKPGVMIYEIANVIERVANINHCTVAHQFVGHGVGIDFHEAPQVPHSYNNIQIPIESGMTFTIEPMINAGVRDGEIDSKDGWTARTIDKEPSAQWEHTVLITDSGYQILTL